MLDEQFARSATAEAIDGLRPQLPKLSVIAAVHERGDLTAIEKLVLCALILKSDSGYRGAYPSAATLATLASVRRTQTIFSALRKIQNLGLITRTSRPGTSSNFTIDPSALDALHPSASSAPQSGYRSGREGGAPDGRAAAPPTGSARSAARMGQSRQAVPDDWTPSMADRERAIARGVPVGEIDRQAEKFRLTAKASGRAFVDVGAAFEAWCLDYRPRLAPMGKMAPRAFSEPTATFPKVLLPDFSGVLS